MNSFLEILRSFYGSSYLPFYDGLSRPRARCKHDASKRGYKHRHNLSLGQRNHHRFLSGL